MENSRRKFIKQTGLLGTGVYLGSLGFSAKSYGRILGANDRVRVGAVGFSDRFKHSLLPSFLNHHKELNFDIVAVSDLWKLRREEGQAHLAGKLGHSITACRNNDELYQLKDLDAVIISTADFQHALHTIEAVNAKCDAYVEKPFAETMDDNRRAAKAVSSEERRVGAACRARVRRG